MSELPSPPARFTDTTPATRFTYDHDGERLDGVHGIAHGGAPGRPAVVLLHGAGTSSKERLLPLLGEFVARGCRGLAFDFSGHGESTGTLRELSLRRRFEQAVAVIDAQVPASEPLVLVGFSMSGQTVADLAAHYGARVASLGLCAPAVYAPEAWDVPFGERNGRFSAIIRTPDRWRRSPALDALRAYEGRAVLVVPGTDAVIPAAVTESVQAALSARARFTRLELPDATHALGMWLRDHERDRGELADALLTGLDDKEGEDGQTWHGRQDRQATQV
ncbi:alpha/beta hydrolase [Streptomyces sp. NPDC046805]|uniref:alpha/beta hydrolase n=1 Tax=Streptomyces sp. NPDC046805 TaxID=3155134 RepID=UPI0033F33D6D